MGLKVKGLGLRGFKGQGVRDYGLRV